MEHAARQIGTCGTRAAGTGLTFAKVRVEHSPKLWAHQPFVLYYDNSFFCFAEPTLLLYCTRRWFSKDNLAFR